MEAMAVPEPWSTLVLLTLFLLYVMLAGSVSVMSYLPEKSAESEALRRVSLVIAVLLSYNYGIRLWAMLPAEMMWMAWVFFSTITFGCIAVTVLFLKYGLRDPADEKTKTTKAAKRAGSLQAPLLSNALPRP